jgi:hypothetical protein
MLHNRVNMLASIGVYALIMVALPVIESVVLDSARASRVHGWLS